MFSSMNMKNIIRSFAYRTTEKGHLAAEICVILYVYPYFFLHFSMISFVAINIHEYLKLIVCVLNHLLKELASIWYNIW